jgi:hypothetical protein
MDSHPFFFSTWSWWWWSDSEWLRSAPALLQATPLPLLSSIAADENRDSGENRNAFDLCLVVVPAERGFRAGYKYNLGFIVWSSPAQLGFLPLTSHNFHPKWRKKKNDGNLGQDISVHFDALCLHVAVCFGQLGRSDGPLTRLPAIQHLAQPQPSWVSYKLLHAQHLLSLVINVLLLRGRILSL